MTWLVLALISPALYTAVNFIDKYLVEAEINDFRALPVYSTLMGFLIGTVFWLLAGRPRLSLTDTAIVLFTGMLTIWAAYLYFKTMTISSASEIVILFQLMPVLILILSFALLGEQVAGRQLVGFGLVLLSVIGVSLRKSRSRWRLSAAFWLIVTVDFLFALAAVLIKLAINATSFTSILSYESWGIGLGGAILYLGLPGVRRAFTESLRSVRKLAIGVILLNECLFILAKSIGFLAYSLGPVALVSVVGSTQVFYGIFLGWALTNVAPAIFQEDTTGQGLLRKIALGSVLLAGVWLVS